MKTNELRERLEQLGVGDEYSIRDAPEPAKLPQDVTILEPRSDGDGWTVYYTERGTVNQQRYFDTEDAACAAAYAQALDS